MVIHMEHFLEVTFLQAFARVKKTPKKTKKTQQPKNPLGCSFFL